jgi:tetratricopeptide (TPR) repeat protein
MKKRIISWPGILSLPLLPQVERKTGANALTGISAGPPRARNSGKPLIWRSNMSTHRYAWIIVLLVYFTATANAQNSRAAAADFYNRGQQRYLKRDLNGAIADFTKAIEISSRPHKPHPQRRQDWKILTDFNGEASEPITLIDPLTAAAYTDRALARYYQGDIEGAIADCERAMAIDPGLADAYNNRGAARSAQGDLDGAMTDFDRAIKINPQFAQAYNNRGNVRDKQGDLAGALADFDQAITLNPRSAEIYCNRGNARRSKGDLVGALADFEQAVKINPRLADGYYNRGMVHADQNNFDRAIYDFTRAIELNPGFAEAYGNRGLVRLHLGQDTEAEKDFAQCLQLDSTLRPKLEQNIQAGKARRAKPQ